MSKAKWFQWEWFPSACFHINAAPLTKTSSKSSIYIQHKHNRIAFQDVRNYKKTRQIKINIQIQYKCFTITNYIPIDDKRPKVVGMVLSNWFPRKLKYFKFCNDSQGASGIWWRNLFPLRDNDSSACKNFISGTRLPCKRFSSVFHYVCLCSVDKDVQIPFETTSFWNKKTSYLHENKSFITYPSLFQWFHPPSYK